MLKNNTKQKHISFIFLMKYYNFTLTNPKKL